VPLQNDLVEALIRADLSKSELLYLLEHVEDSKIDSLKDFQRIRKTQTDHDIGCWDCDSILQALTQIYLTSVDSR